MDTNTQDPDLQRQPPAQSECLAPGLRATQRATDLPPDALTHTGMAHLSCSPSRALMPWSWLLLKAISKKKYEIHRHIEAFDVKNCWGQYPLRHIMFSTGKNLTSLRNWPSAFLISKHFPKALINITWPRKPDACLPLWAPRCSYAGHGCPCMYRSAYVFVGVRVFVYIFLCQRHHPLREMVL